MAKLYTAKSYVHPTAKAYFDKIATAGGSVSDKKAVNDFVIGLCKIMHPSLWVCWPLCSSQNIGTGTTAYSLGGLGNFNGTLVNNPTWATEGITFASVSSHHILTSLKISTGSNYTVIGVAKYTNATVDYPCAVSAGNQAASQLYARGNGSTAIYGDAWNFAGGTSAGTSNSSYSTLNRYMSLVAGDSGSVQFWWNNTQYNSIAGDFRVGASNSGRVTIGAANINDPLNAVNVRYNGTISLGMISTIKLDSTQRTALYVLYKATLGQVLSLP